MPIEDKSAEAKSKVRTSDRPSCRCKISTCPHVQATKRCRSAVVRKPVRCAVSERWQAFFCFVFIFVEQGVFKACAICCR